MKKIFEFLRKYEMFIYFFLALLFLITLFIPFVHYNNESGGDLITNSVLTYIQNHSFLEFLRHDLIYFIVLVGIILSAFNKKHKAFCIIRNLTCILFLFFFIGKEGNRFFLDYALSNNASFVSAGVSMYIWIFLVIIDCIYLFMALQKAFPFKKNTNSDEDKNS